MLAALIFKAASVSRRWKAELNPARPPELQARFFLQRGFVQKGEASWMVACQGALPLVLLESQKKYCSGDDGVLGAPASLVYATVVAMGRRLQRFAQASFCRAD